MLETSPMYKKFFLNNRIDYLGRMNKRTGKPNKVTVNTSYAQFLVENGMSKPKSHGVHIKNAEAEYKATAKYAKDEPWLDEKAWQSSYEWTIRHFGGIHCGNAMVITLEEAMASVDKQTSAGFPANMLYRNKAAMFKCDKACKIFPDYWEMIALPLEQQTLVPIWSCVQKVELREQEKLDENSARVFVVSPVEHTVALNMLCLDFNNKFYESNNKTWSFVGGSKFEGGFNMIHSRLSKFPNAFELDERQYDSSLFARALGEQVNLRMDCMATAYRTQTMRHRLEILYHWIIHSVMVMSNGELLWKHIGNPSGCGNTIVDNTILLFRLFAYSWIVLGKEYKVEQSYLYSHFINNVVAVLNGDDNTFSVSNECVTWFNPVNIATCWKNVGITTITPNASWGQSVKDVSFLSQYFVNLEGFWYPAPNGQKTLCSLLYNADVDDPRWHLLRACAMRIDTWANVEVRKHIMMYIEFMWSRYKNLYAADSKIGMITMAQIRALYRSDQWIRKLYRGEENLGHRDRKNNCAKENFTSVNRNEKLIDQIASLVDVGSRSRKEVST